MKDIEFFYFMVLFVAVFVTMLILWWRVRKNDEEIELLRSGLRHKINENTFNFERDIRRGIQNELDALKEYLDVEVVEPENKVKMRSKK